MALSWRACKFRATEHAQQRPAGGNSRKWYVVFDVIDRATVNLGD
jgi:hypothetical protein